MKRFFKPFEGEHYKEGIQGKRILVVGASCYCDKTSCPFFKECTDPNKKDSSKFDAKCPDYVGEETLLSDEPTTIISQGYRTPSNFARFMQKFVGEEDTWTTWNRMAFTEYMQFVSPTKDTKNYLSDRDFEAFLETLRELQPHIVFAWGMAILEEIREKNKYVYDKNKAQLEKTEYYVWHMKVPGVSHNITIVHSYHPSAPGYWYGNLDILTKYMQMALDE